MPDFSSYLESVRRHYTQWWSLYTLTDAERRSQVKAKGAVFDFGLMVQTIAPKSERMEGDRLEKETIERFTVLEGLRKYAVNHVLLVGRPGSGKSTALARLLLEEAEKDDRIPVLVELRYWNEGGVLGLIQGFLRSLPTQVGLTPVEIDRTTLEGLLRSNKFLLLMDGLNELPSEAARQDVLRFRRDFPKVAIVFTTRDLNLGGDFGIEKKLEMQPLTETQMKAFVTAYIPEQSEAMLRQLGGRLREFGSTPLLLWMLCGLFRQTGEIPANLGGVFRAFTTGYERSLKADVVAEGDRRWWAGLLQALAARMMIGDGSVEFRVAIDRAEVEAIFTEFLRDREAQAAGAARKALDDLLRHHLIQTNGSQVEFRHQLIQEYYATEWLLGQVNRLDDATLQQDYLNYLKWTEPVALMLALVEDEAIAVRVVALALDVDLMLGARLAGEVRSDFQAKMIDLIKSLHHPKWLEVYLISKTHLTTSVSYLLKILETEIVEISLCALRGLTLNCSDEIRSILSPYLQKTIEENPDLSNKFYQLSTLGFMEEDREGYILPINLDDAYESMKVYGDLTEVSKSCELLFTPDCLDDCSSDLSSRVSIARNLGKNYSVVAAITLLELLQDKSFVVRYFAMKSLSRFRNQQVMSLQPQLLKLLSNSCGREVFQAIQGIQANCKFYNYEIQQAKLRKADQPSCLEENCPSLEGGGGDLSLAIIEDKLDRYREEVKQVTSEPTYGSKYSITGNPTIVEGNMEVKGDNVGTKNIHNYFGADEALLQQITDLQTFITEIEAQHPNLQTEDQANTVVQTKLDQLQTQNPDRWQKLRQQMQILKAQFFNPERHAQALKATVVEVAKAKWEESLIVKAIVTYLDKFSETPEKGA